jgi:hypothetical protein
MANVSRHHLPLFLEASQDKMDLVRWAVSRQAY